MNAAPTTTTESRAEGKTAARFFPASATLIQRKCKRCEAENERRIQTKLTIGLPDDKYEREADRVAAQVMRMPAPQPASSIDDAFFPANRAAPPGQHQVQRRTAAEEPEDRELVQTRVSAGAKPAATSTLSADIQSLQGRGQPLSRSERNFFEPRFGSDFSKVRVHDNSRAAHIARSVNARAFTHGHDLVFGAGEHAPTTPAGRELLAHELTHVIQQRNGTGLGQAAIQRRTVRRNYATAYFERGPLCDVRLTITGAPRADTDALMDFISAAMEGTRRACGTLPRASSRRVRVTMRYRRHALYTDVSRRAYVAARMSVLGRAADPAHIAAEARAATERERVARLQANYQRAIRSGNWQRAAEYLNGFNDADIAARLRLLTLTQLGELRRGAVTNRRLGGGTRLAAAIDSVNPDALRVATLINNYETARAAGNWAAAAGHLNGFNDGDIRARLRRLSRLELSMLRDGAVRNPALGGGARLVALIDGVAAAPPLLGVGAACFDGTTITVTKNRASHSCTAFTGSIGAPTPNGRYCIRRQGEAQIAGGITGRVFQDRDVWHLIEPQFSTTRSRMQLHPGTRSSGCITVNDRACFDRLAALLNRPGTDSGHGYDGYPPGNSDGVSNRRRSIRCVAWLDISSTSGSCSP